MGPVSSHQRPASSAKRRSSSGSALAAVGDGSGTAETILGRRPVLPGQGCFADPG